MPKPAIRYNRQVCDALPSSTTHRGSPDVAGCSAYPSIAVISISLPDRREGPTTDIIGALDTVNSLYEEPFFSCRQGGGSPPPAATGSPFPIRAVSEKHLQAELSLVRRTGRWSSVPLASRPSGNRLGRFRPMLARGDSRMVCCPAGSSLSHSCHLKLCKFGKLCQVLIFLPFLHSARRIFSQL